MTDKTLITKALKLWFQRGDVFEIRALDATTTDYRRPHVESGYFDYEHIDSAAKEVAKMCSYGGVYVTINPVNPDLLARACNRMKYAGKTPATGDGDILRRSWLLIDCDAVRPAGISSTDEEHGAALAKAREIRDHLTSLGWPEPIMLNSGNGAQMTYRIDLPSDDGGLVSRVLSALSVMSDDQVKLDVTHIPGVSPGDVVTIVGEDGGKRLTFDEMARLSGTISYEKVCLIGKRVPRIYRQNGKDVGVVDFIRSKR